VPPSNPLEEHQNDLYTQEIDSLRQSYQTMLAKNFGKAPPRKDRIRGDLDPYEHPDDLEAFK